MNALLPILSLFLLSADGSARAESGEAAVARYLDALGGAEALDAVESLTATGRYQVEGGPGGTITLHLARPDKLLFRVDLGGIGVIEQGTDGETAWSVHPVNGTRILEGDDLATLEKWMARGFSLLPDASAFSAIGPAEPGEHDGVSCLRVELTLRATGETYEDCYHPDTGLLVGRTETLSTPSGPAPMLGWSSDYREVDGLRFAMRWRHQVASQFWYAQYEAIELNGVDDGVFAPPASVVSLLESDPTAD